MAKKYSNKQLFELWFKYLKQSDDFKELASWYRDAIQSGHARTYPFPRKFKNKGEYHPILAQYGLRGFVEAEAKGWTFDYLWERQGGDFVSRYSAADKKMRWSKPIKRPPVRSISEYLEESSDLSLRWCGIVTKKSDFSAAEFKSFLVEWSTHYLPNTFVIDLDECSMSKLQSLLAQKKRERKIQTKKSKVHS